MSITHVNTNMKKSEPLAAALDILRENISDPAAARVADAAPTPVETRQPFDWLYPAFDANFAFHGVVYNIWRHKENVLIESDFTPGACSVELDNGVRGHGTTPRAAYAAAYREWRLAQHDVAILLMTRSIAVLDCVELTSHNIKAQNKIAALNATITAHEEQAKADAEIAMSQAAALVTARKEIVALETESHYNRNQLIKAQEHAASLEAAAPSESDVLRELKTVKVERDLWRTQHAALSQSYRELSAKCQQHAPGLLPQTAMVTL